MSKEDTDILVLVKGTWSGYGLEKVFIDEVLATNEDIPQLTNTLESQ